ncbi:MAG: ATP-binding cassette domain-containing protein [Bacteroidetes bacterium]|nr:ATP-binding cassette domain-containing protein [Bacteroidota bacterium]
MDIPKGKIIFLLGASGSGKSTLLETLGLMNNTIAQGEINFNTDIKISFPELWAANNQVQLSEVRKKHFSFIFQNTNLMENFTAYENVCLSRMIKEDATQEEVLESAKALMQKVKLPENEVGLSSLAVNLSGGQRQRVAFVRALNAGFTVLFGDEPTGNLDEANANELFEVIKSNINENLTAIIVSHDINLAVKHADQIVVITKNKEKGYGESLPENIFYKTEFENFDEKSTADLKLKIRALYTSNADKNLQPQQQTQKLNLKNTYSSLFFKKEREALLGKRWVNFIILTSILFFTFLAIGFANGSLHYLDKKMNSAFVNWLTVNIPFEKSDNNFIDRLKDRLDDKELKSQYGYQNIGTYLEEPLWIYDETRKDFYRARGRSIDVEQDKKLMREDILGEKNLVVGDKEGFKEKDLSVIVTRRMLEEYHYDLNTPYILLQYTIKDTATGQSVFQKIPIAIRAVVEELPGKAVLVYPIYFIKVWESTDNVFDLRKFNRKIVFQIFAGKEEAGKISEKIKSAITSNTSLSTHNPDFNGPVLATEPYAESYNYMADFLPVLDDLKQSDAVVESVMLALGPDAAKVKRSYDYNTTNREHYSDVSFDVISIYFNNLDNVREFSNFVYNNFNKKEENAKIEVDISKIKEKENFNFLSKVTKIISVLLVLFSMVAVSLFIINLLKAHLSKVRMNIGTFKAIGLGNNESRNIYFRIIVLFVFLSVSLAFAMAWGVGLVLDKSLTANLVVEQGISYFKMLDVNTWVTMGVILTTSGVVSWIITTQMLNRTPGDLIYNR